MKRQYIVLAVLAVVFTVLAISATTLRSEPRNAQITEQNRKLLRLPKV